MVKKAVLAMACLMLLGLVSGCTSYYTIVKQTEPAGDLKQYQEINVGWLDLGEEKYEKYGFTEKDKKEWADMVKGENLENFPKYLREFMPAKKINTTKAKGEALAKRGLIVKFSDVNYNQQTSSAAKILFGAYAGSDSLDVTVHFIDGASGKELYTSSISLTSEAGHTGFSSMSFPGRVDNTVYNLAQYVAEQTK